MKLPATSTIPDSDEEECGPSLAYAGVLKAGTAAKRKSSEKPITVTLEKKKKTLEDRLGEAMKYFILNFATVVAILDCRYVMKGS